MNSSTITNLIGITLFAIVSILIYTLLPKQEKSEISQPFCGTIDEVNTSLNTSASIGKSLFMDNCVMCHAKDMKTTTIGPSLEGSFIRWDNDTVKFRKYLNNSIDFERDSRITSLRKELEFSGVSHKNYFTNNEVRDIIEYMASIQ